MPWKFGDNQRYAVVLPGSRTRRALISDRFLLQDSCQIPAAPWASAHQKPLETLAAVARRNVLHEHLTAGSKVQASLHAAAVVQLPWIRPYSDI